LNGACETFACAFFLSPVREASAGLSLVVLLAIEKPFMCRPISGHFEQIKMD